MYIYIYIYNKQSPKPAGSPAVQFQMCRGTCFVVVLEWVANLPLLGMAGGPSSRAAGTPGGRPGGRATGLPGARDDSRPGGLLGGQAGWQPGGGASIHGSNIYAYIYIYIYQSGVAYQL